MHLSRELREVVGQHCIVSQSDTSHHQRQLEINGSFPRTGAIRAGCTALIGFVDFALSVGLQNSRKNTSLRIRHVITSDYYC